MRGLSVTDWHRHKRPHRHRSSCQACQHASPPRPFPDQPQIPIIRGHARHATCFAPAPEGLYCPPGDFFIDPVRPVARALITHGHSDHARPGHGAVLATRQTLDIMALRYGEDFAGATQEAGPRRDGRTSTASPSPSIRPAMCSARRRSRSSTTARASSPPATTSGSPTRPACPSSRSAATSSSPRRPSACRSSAIRPTRDEIGKLLKSAEQFPERAHLVGAYALGKAQRVIRLIRDAGYDQPIYIHGALAKLCDYYQSAGHRSRRPPAGDGRGRRQAGDFAGAIVVGPPSAFADRWARRFPDPISCFASGWMRIRQRAKQGGVELPLIISDHSDWDELTDNDPRDRRAARSGSRTAARRRWCAGASSQGIAARPLHLVGYEDEGD